MPVRKTPRPRGGRERGGAFCSTSSPNSTQTNLFLLWPSPKTGTRAYQQRLLRHVLFLPLLLRTPASPACNFPSLLFFYLSRQKSKVRNRGMEDGKKIEPNAEVPSKCGWEAPSHFQRLSSFHGGNYNFIIFLDTQPSAGDNFCITAIQLH